MHAPSWLTDELERSLMHSASAAHPRECAGLVIEDQHTKLSLLECPAHYTSQHSFEFPASLFLQMRALGAKPIAIYHSHPSGHGELSVQDLRTMLIAGRPSWPNVDWVVIPCDPEDVQPPICYYWDEASAQYLRRADRA